jgi:hypothetical protein
MSFQYRALRSLVRATALALTLTLAVLAPRTAHAQTKLAIDLGADLPSASGNDDGWGAGLRLGRQWNLTLLKLVPEIGFDYHSFGGSADTTAFRFVGGGRFGIDLGVEPIVFAHAGIGHWSAADASQTSLGYDIGAALDLTILPVVSFGAHVMETGIAGSNGTSAFTWVEIGGHVSFNIGS